MIQDSLDGKLSVRESAAALNLSERQVIRLRNGVKEKGHMAVVHQTKAALLPTPYPKRPSKPSSL